MTVWGVRRCYPRTEKCQESNQRGSTEQPLNHPDQVVAMGAFSTDRRSSTTANIGKYMNSTIERPTSM